MNFSILSLNTARALAVGSLLIAAGCTTPRATKPAAEPAQAAAPSKPAAEGAFDDDPRPVTAIEQIVNSAGLDAVKLAAAQRDLLAILQKPDTPASERQEAAQQLGFILLTGDSAGHAATLNLLAPMLADPARSDYARLALDRVPSASIDTLYLQALLSTSGRTQLGIIDAIGTRRVAAAAPALAGLLDAPETAAAAASALGRIGGPAALDALARAQNPRSHDILKARLAAAQADTATAAKVAGEIHRDPAAPLGQRAAALRQLIAASPAIATEIIHDILAGSEPAFHATAIESVTSLPGADTGAKLAASLGSYTPAVQTALIAALGRRGDASAVPGLLAALDHTDTTVRLAALEALGRLPGNPDVARRLATLATGKSDEAKAAATALARLNGPGLDDFVRAEAATDGDNVRRAVFIQQIAARNLTEAIPFLLGLRTSPVESLRLEALDALRLIAAPADQAAVIAWATGAANRNEQNRAVRALITIILRDGAVATRAAPVVAALESGNADARLVLLPVLSRVAGAPALATAATLARSADDPVAQAATAELSRWPDAEALPVLVELAVATGSESIRAAAVQGAARFLALRTPAVKAGRSGQIRALLGLPLNATTRTTLLNVLSLCADPDALAAARRFASDADAEVAAAARDAVDAITSNLAGAPVMTASAESEGAVRMADGNGNTYWQVPVELGLWIRADFHNSRPVRKLTLEHGNRGWGYPGQFTVQASDNPEQPGEAVAEGEGERTGSVITLPAGTRGRYVWVRVTKLRDAPIAISELIVE
ncbi:MAG: hypothetical protein QG602_991 [Verrucomicrobiota bacterium]|nr:hypothetical protein [Verrucomicrobiota bacterium]